MYLWDGPLIKPCISNTCCVWFVNMILISVIEILEVWYLRKWQWNCWKAMNNFYHLFRKMARIDYSRWKRIWAHMIAYVSNLHCNFFRSFVTCVALSTMSTRSTNLGYDTTFMIWIIWGCISSDYTQMWKHSLWYPNNDKIWNKVEGTR